ncbi:spermidine/putrescine ABC transporter ATP-binding protein [Streptomonospora alba]|uniref:Spermidine/putrescine import ATP-binding protein PotA n=1 Tax=Streptomonospora alba TaxID=183763 RepID=A0A0C2GAK8_9ACTN|nr:ABC transporter ATP-binding protein [Streptomonospora alba]KII00444.1 spermidine/putrescine ABC transporter ATP-binding protein [Streptomonospora alba]
MATATEEPRTRHDAGARAGTPAISLEQISKAYRSGGEDVQAVRGIDLRIEQGEFFSLLGPSGCGKTTTMRMVAGFESPTSGTVRLHGDDVTGVAPHRRDVNMVFQSYALFPHMTVFDNVAFGLRRKREASGEIRRKVAEALELVELNGRERTKPGRLSGGQQQRVALARALVNRPSALLLDEPLGALDLKLRQAMQMELKRIQRDVGITFVYVTHDQGEALTMSDRIAVMNGGRVEQLGTPAEVYERPATRFTAGFIGTSNLLSGTVAGRSGEVATVRIEGAGEVRASCDAPAGARVDLTVRPEKIAMEAEEPAGDRARLAGTVTEVVYLGSATHYTVRLGDGSEVVVFRQNASDAASAAERGETVWVSWRPEHAYALPG